MTPWSGCVPSFKGNQLDASLSREEMVGGPPCFGELEK